MLGLSLEPSSQELFQANSEMRKDYLFAVLFLDLDRFKGVNNGLGQYSSQRSTRDRLVHHNEFGSYSLD